MQALAAQSAGVSTAAASAPDGASHANRTPSSAHSAASAAAHPSGASGNAPVGATAPGNSPAAPLPAGPGGGTRTFRPLLSPPPPTITSPGAQTNHEADAVSLQVQASDPGGTLVFGSSGLPAGLTIDSASGLISGTLAYTDAETNGGSYTTTVTAYDSASGASASTAFGWTVQDANPAPVLPNPGNLSNREGDAVALGLGATDADGQALTYSASGLPTGLSLNTTTGLISGVIASTAGTGSPYTTTVTASDANASASQTFTWAVSRVQISGMGDQSGLTGDVVSLPLYAWTTSGQALTYSATGLPPGLSVNTSTGLVSGTVSTSASLTTPYSVTATASDGSDHASTTFNWSIAALSVVNPGDQANAEATWWPWGWAPPATATRC